MQYNLIRYIQNVKPLRIVVSVWLKLLCVLLTAPLNSPDQDSQISAYSWKEIDKSTGMDVHKYVCSPPKQTNHNKEWASTPLQGGKKPWHYIFFLLCLVGHIKTPGRDHKVIKTKCTNTSINATMSAVYVG